MNKCRCTTIQHGHADNKCSVEATENDNLCKQCHDKAANEWITAQPLLINVFDSIKVRDLVGPVILLKEYTEKRPLFILLLTLLYLFFGWLTSFAITNPWIMFITNLVIDAITFYIGLFAITKVKEITK